jgi:hypothetical protein
MLDGRSGLTNAADSVGFPLKLLIVFYACAFHSGCWLLLFKISGVYTLVLLHMCVYIVYMCTYTR